MDRNNEVKVEKLVNRIKIEDHPFTQIQLSDREKFHTGMLKLTLDHYGKYAYHKIFGQPFFDELCKDVKDFQKEIKTCLEEKSVDLVIKKDNSKGKKDVFAIVESKFKTGLHYSKMKINNKSEYVNQLIKYARKNPNTKYGFVVSLFAENQYDLKISDETTEIKEFRQIHFLEQVLEFLNNPSHENDLDEKQGKKYEELKKSAREPIIALWKDYLEELKLIVDKFPEDDLKGIANESEIAEKLSRIKLKGIFERYRLNIIKKNIINNNINGVPLLKEDLKNKLIEGANIWGIPDAKNNYIIIGNTHGNASISFVLKTEKKNSYGIQWQAGSIKIFIDISKINEKMRKDRHKQLNSLVVKLKDRIVEGKADMFIEDVKANENKKDKFQSITIIKKKMFEDIEEMPNKLISILKILKANLPSCL